MTVLDKTAREILKRKNAAIRAEREKLEAAEWSNRILSAYIALLARERELHVKMCEVSDILGAYRSAVRRCGEDYVITLEKTVHDGDGKRVGFGD